MQALRKKFGEAMSLGKVDAAKQLSRLRLLKSKQRERTLAQLANLEMLVRARPPLPLPRPWPLCRA